MNKQTKLGIGIAAIGVIVGVLIVANSRSTTQAPKLTVVFPSRSEATDLQRKTKAVASLISKEMNQPIEAVMGDDTAAVEALRANRADVAFLGSRAALKANQLANASLYLAEVRPNYSGGHTYKSVFVVLKDSALKSGTTPDTLNQLKGKKISFNSPTSGSGFIFPVGELVSNKLVPDRDRLNSFFGQVSYGGGYDKALQAVLRGQADVATVSEYALGEPHITKAEAQRLRVLYSVPGVPAHGIAIDDDVPAETRNKLVAALMKLNEPAHNELLKSLYNSTELVKIDHDQHLQPMQTALQKANMKP